MREKTLPPFLGIRIKPLNEDLRARSMRTLDIFVTALAAATSGKLPDNFVITVPKIQLPEQVRAAIQLFALLEKKTGLPAGSLKIEPMIETPQSIINQRGEIALHSLVDAAEGRCGSVHFGVYDYTASSGITAAYQAMRHPACDFARQMMLVSLAGTGIHLSDGATNILPVGPHRATADRPLTSEQAARESRRRSPGLAARFRGQPAFACALVFIRAGICILRNSSHVTRRSICFFSPVSRAPQTGSRLSSRKRLSPLYLAMFSMMPPPARGCLIFSCAASLAAPSRRAKRSPRA